MWYTPRLGPLLKEGSAMKAGVIVLVLGMGLGAAGIALAQADIVQEPETVIYQAVTVIDVQEPAVIVGTLVGPAGSYLPAKRGAEFKLLIPVRVDFQPEIMNSADGL